MIVTSTSHIENYKITNYIGLINANVVIGTNFISDFFASITDEIGGYSYSYQDKLDGIYQRALNELKLKASQNGANALLGVHFDFDEISEKGKAMFMVTATGTAVKVIPNNAIQNDRYEIYQKLYNLTLFKDSGVITQEQYDAEKNNLILIHKEKIDNDIESIKTESMNIEIERENIRIREEEKKELKEKEFKEQELKKVIAEKYNLVRNILKDNIEDPEQKLKVLTLEKVEQANYEALDFGNSQNTANIIAKLIKQNKIAEACKYYMDTTNDNDFEYAKTYIQGIYDAISFKFQVSFERLAIKLIELKNYNKRKEAIEELIQYTLCDISSAEKIIDLL